MSRLRILHIDGGHGWGGGQRQVWLLGEWQRQQGQSVALAAPRTGELFRRARRSGWVTKGLRRARPLSLGSLVRVSRAVRQQAINVVHTHTPGASALVAILRRLGAVPVHVTTRRTAFPISGIWSRSRARWIAGAGLDGMIAISQSAAHCVLAAGGRPHRLAILPSAVVLESGLGAGTPSSVMANAADGVSPLGEAAAPQLPDGVPQAWLGCRLVGTIGALEPEKGIHHLVMAWPRILEICGAARLLIVGEGSQRQRLQESVQRQRLESSIHFTGWLRDPGLLVASLDVLVQPSTREALANAVLEAMAVGTPVIASAVGGLPELLSSGAAGELVSAADPRSLVRAVVELLTDSRRSRELSVAGRRRVESGFSMAALGPAVEGFYRGVLGTTSTKTPAAARRPR